MLQRKSVLVHTPVRAIEFGFKDSLSFSQFPLFTNLANLLYNIFLKKLFDFIFICYLVKFNKLFLYMLYMYV